MGLGEKQGDIRDQKGAHLRFLAFEEHRHRQADHTENE